MKIRLATLLFIIVATIARAEQPIDLTGASAGTFKPNVGHTVSLRGRLEEGMHGLCLSDATPTNVVFYVIPDVPTNGSYAFPKAWDKLRHREVRVTGKLKFRPFDRKKPGPFDQISPDYYYMVAQQTTIEPLEKK